MKPAPQEAMNTATHFTARCHVDQIGPFTLSENKNKYLLVMIDAFSSYVKCVPTPNKEAATIYKAFLSGIGFKHTFSSVAHPNSNGQVERANRNILAYMRKIHNKKNSDWESMLPALKFALNQAPHSTKRYSPFQNFTVDVQTWHTCFITKLNLTLRSLNKD
jgi:hypothetical protein